MAREPGNAGNAQRSAALRALLAPSGLPIGVDIGPSGVRLLQAKQTRRGLRVIGAARLDLPRAGEPGSSQWVEAVVSSVRRRLESGGFSGRRCVVGLEGRLVRARALRQPTMPDAELDRALRLDAPGRLGFTDEEQIEVGWMRAGEVRQGEELRDEILLMGARREPIEALVYALAHAGLTPLAVEPGFVSCARSFARMLRRTSDQGTVRAVVEIGPRGTSVMLLRGRSLAFYKPLEIGGETMTKAAAERLGLEPRTIEDLRRQRSILAAAGKETTDARVDRALFEAVRPIMGDLAQEVALCLRYYGVTFRGARPDSCLLVGPEAGEPRMSQVVEEILHVRTLVGDPLQGMELSGGVDLGAPGPVGAAGWSVAAGLSLRPLERTWGGRVAPRKIDERAVAAATNGTTKSARAAA